MKFLQSIFIITAILSTSCATKQDSKTAEQTEPRVMATSAAEIKNETPPTNSPTRHNSKNIYKTYKIEFWDSINPQLYPQAKINRLAEHKQRGKSRDAFYAGRRFSTIIYNGKTSDSTVSDSSSAFLDFINQQEDNGDVAVTPFVVAGNYFQMLAEVAKNKNPETGNIDEKTLKKGIEATDGLKNYINASLQESSDIKLNVMLQKISQYADSVKNTYFFCTQQQDENRYQKFYELLQSIENDVFN